MHKLTKQLVNEAKEEKAEKTAAVKPSTRELVYIGMFAAILAILSQISIPMPSGMPITLQTFAVALTGYVLAWKRGTAATFIYILLGAVGIPVFSGLRGGVQVIAGHTGGFIWGFVFMAMLCGIGIMQESKMVGIMIGFIGLAICHLLGVIQFAVVMEMDFLKAFLLVSAPYLIKDAVSVILAYILGYRIRISLIKANLI